MIESKVTSASAAFEELLDELDEKMGVVNQTGAKAFEKGDHEEAAKAIAHAKQLTTLQAKVLQLREEWNALYPVQVPSQMRVVADSQAERRNLGRLQRGQRTPEKAFEIPILKALTEMGGLARMGVVLVRVEQLMRSSLKPVDYENLKSTSEPRWRNTGQWARNTMVENGLLKSDSPWGFWGITDKGRRYLTEHSA